MTERRDLILARGTPGSGKTTFALLIKSLNNCVQIFCTDDYFMVDGEYKFDAEKLPEHHKANQLQVEKAMQHSITESEYYGLPVDNVIVVHNTFRQEWEMEPYYSLADKYDYNVTSLVIENRHGGKNIHGVQDGKVKFMAKRFDLKL